MCPEGQIDGIPLQRVLETFKGARRLQEAGGEEELDTEVSMEDGESRVRPCQRKAHAPHFPVLRGGFLGDLVA